MVSQESPTVATRFPIVRVQPGGECRLTLLSDEWVRVATHFYKRTFLCTEVDECPACALLPSRPYWYLPAVIEGINRYALLEMSSVVCADLEQQCRFQGFSVGQGTDVILRRRSKRAPLRVEVLGERTMSGSMPMEVWLSALMAIYGLPAVRPGEDVDSYSVRLTDFAHKRAESIIASVAL